MVLCDLNIPWPCKDYTKPTASQLQHLKLTLLCCQSLQYTHIAINFTISQDVKIPTTPSEINPIDITDLMKDMDLQIYTRVTLIIDDISNLANFSKLAQHFDLLSVLPLSEKLLMLAVTQDIDLITFKYDERLPCFLKHKLMKSAIDKGIKFEIVYQSLFTSNKKQFFTNTLSLIRSTRNRGMIISSGAQSALQVKLMFDITNLLIVLGLNHNSCLLSMTDLPLKVILNGKLRNKSYKQLITVEGKRKLDSLLQRQQKKFKK